MDRKRNETIRCNVTWFTRLTKISWVDVERSGEKSEVFTLQNSIQLWWRH